MFRWIASDDERRPEAEGPAVVVRVADSQGNEPVTIGLQMETGGTDAPTLVARTRDGKICDIEPAPLEKRPGVVRCVLSVDPPADPTADDEVTIELRGPQGSGVPGCAATDGLPRQLGPRGAG